MHSLKYLVERYSNTLYTKPVNENWLKLFLFLQPDRSVFGLGHDINLESYSVDNKSSVLFIRLQSKKQTAFKINLYVSPNNLKNSDIYDLNIKDYFIKQLT